MNQYTQRFDATNEAGHYRAKEKIGSYGSCTNTLREILCLKTQKRTTINVIMITFILENATLYTLFEYHYKVSATRIAVTFQIPQV